MAFIGIGFTWSRCPDLYSIKKSRAEIDDPILANLAAPYPCLVPNSSRREAVTPLAAESGNKELFHRFANLHGKPDYALAAFADDYGLLDAYSSHHAEPVKEWRLRIAELRSAIDRANLPEQRGRLIRELSQAPHLAQLALKLVAMPGGGATFRAAPQDLYGAIWLQFVNALVQDREMRVCDFCADWFAAGGRGQPKRFCSDKCSDAHHNRRKKESRK